MQIHRDTSSIPVFNFPVVTTGTFDGVHAGHQVILEHLVNEAKVNKGESVVVTFDPHPRLVLNPEDKTLQLLNTLDERISKLEKLGVDHLIIIHFTKQFSQTSSEEFLNEFLVKKLKTKILVVGYDHHFGKDREGKYAYLKKVASQLGFEIREIPARMIGSKTVSSSLIRESLLKGDVELASSLIGEPYELTATVTDGHKIGRTLGFPTANLKIENDWKLIPSNGVYAVNLIIEGYSTVYKGMMNIGVRPTFSDEKTTNIELHIIDFNELIYQKKITVYFRKFIREEIKFSDLQALKLQLEKDKRSALQLLH